jgi:hypothetical protein
MFAVSSLTRSIQPGKAALGIGLSIRRTCSRSIALASGHQSTKGKDVVPHSPYRRIKVLNPRENNGLRGVPGAGNQYLSTIDTAGHKADDWFGGSGKQRAPSE